MEAMHENEFSPVGKILTIIILAWFAATAIANISRGEVAHPFAFSVALLSPEETLNQNQKRTQSHQRKVDDKNGVVEAERDEEGIHRRHRIHIG